MSRKKSREANAKSRMNRRLRRFYHKHIGSMNGVKVNAAARAILQRLGHEVPDTGIRLAAMQAIAASEGSVLPRIASKPKPQTTKPTPSVSTKAEFYASWEWQTLRMKTLKRCGRRCMCCGAEPGQVTVSGEPVRLHVDHIKPLSKHWDMRLDPENVQVLCAECNKGKGAWDETDWRESAA